MKFTMSSRTKGLVCVVLSAILYGLAPLFAQHAYAGGASSFSLNFLRGGLALPVLYVVLRIRRIPIKPEPGQLRKLAISGIFGQAASSLLLYSSFSYISTGIAATLHFIYPTLVAVACVVFYKEPLNRWKVLALVSGALGIILFLDGSGGSGSALGIILALASGFTFAFTILYMDRAGLKNMYYFKYTFYSCLFMSLCSGVAGLLAGKLWLDLTPKGWVFAFLVSMLCAVGALSLFQIGVSLIGATTAAILSTFEPITSVLIGIFFLNEQATPLKLLGCVCILASVLLINISSHQSEKSG